MPEPIWDLAGGGAPVPAQAEGRPCYGLGTQEVGCMPGTARDSLSLPWNLSQGSKGRGQPSTCAPGEVFKLLASVF